MITDYKIISKLGEGKYAFAYHVIERSSKKQYCMRILKLQKRNGISFEDMEIEVNVLECLDTPFVVKCHKHFEHTDRLVMITELCELGDFFAMINESKKEQKKFTENQIIDWMIQILLVMQQCHHQKILHRDINVKNIFLANDYSAKLGDFGAFKILSNSNDKASSIVTTYSSLAPEICAGHKYNHKSDIWSVGIVLYQLCALELPFYSTIIQQNYKN
ncbi:MAG: putative serine/threonine-protein kinase Nek1 [Streblomastix strix]|uniref:non-specific serine/threonine protein kinase n=1 Tax=Streblomastix strix TaxID=222440 RepID=A0A5J4VY92_9EUKA|nr:MAG: putative serine/threonine-protein kinase Nek1 [Streblomastix strix]